jgi:hypothetical protein
MPITLPCSCGKTLKVNDNLAGKRVKCPVCGGVMAVPAAPAEREPVLEPLDDDEPDAAGGPAEPGTRAPAKKKKKKGKKRAKAKTREEVDAEYARWLQRTYWRKRIFRGSAFVALGMIIIGGSTYLLVLHPEDVRPVYSWLLLLTGVAGVVKGLIGLFFGRFFGEDE